MTPTKVIIMGAAGRDFHNFNVYFRDNENYRVVAFTATQIPNIEGRVYPPELAGRLYPQGVPIHPEEELADLIKKYDVDQVVFAYSDVPHSYVMSKASQVAAAGADFRLMGPKSTMLKSKKPVVAVTAVRTGVGKSQTTRRVCDILKAKGKRVVAVRHPMPYGDLARQACQRFADYGDLDAHRCTIEEREEYEPHIDRGVIVYAGVDYGKILAEAEKEADVIVWDGGNNDFSFYWADLYITLADPHRPGHELSYHPGETNLRLADVVVLNKVETADAQGINTVRANIARVNPGAVVVEAASPIFVEKGELIRGKKVLVVEDGPTLTHGEMLYGAGVIAARKYGAAELVDPRPFAVGTIVDTYRKYPHIGALLPAMGYGEEQIRDLEATINRSDAELVVIATPIDLRRVIKIEKPALRIRYELQEIGEPTLEQLLQKVL
ncbi:MAG TPA: cyclic 2,3-diphosphoglycerate synthase [Bacillota bacterium]|jgi:predicted GTPase|nr:GTPase [Bacillota bacterium]HOB87206.1 cyclic 2,3-diphosphoglycerate synthase [Bacillota bacterium]HOP69763.1 cyclic 2,3-diphosphoglycerate synthase [Bacillota bacterium]HPT34672.1 cyclic 2,3-diphosphoglycerate synthase [Bacillota bacterium]HQD06824.1 cyclic 2,3-diphosphoglycerate synthase [Bacillota bacterium]